MFIQLFKYILSSNRNGCRCRIPIWRTPSPPRWGALSSAQVAEFCTFFHPSLHGWQNFAFFALFLHPPLHRLQYFSSFQNFAFFSSQAWRVVGRPTGISYGRCSILDPQIWQTFRSHLSCWNPEVPGLKQCQREEQYFGGPVLHWRGLAAPEVPRYVDQVGAQ